MRGVVGVLAAVSVALGSPGAVSAAVSPTPSFSPPPIRHVFVVVEENEDAATSFGPASPAPYLSKTLKSDGAYLPNYYGIGHNSLDNYIAMVSGQAPNPLTSGDCGTYAEFGAPALVGGQEAGQGCVYPANVPTLMSQLDATHLTWRAYEDGMGVDPARDNAANPTDPNCGHPILGTADQTEGETATDQYATKHDPFVYFHYVIDNPTRCNADVVPFTQLTTDLRSASTTPNYVFITPGLCDDGHDAPCANGESGGLVQVNAFLRTVVPRITASPAFQQSGLLIVTFDEASAGGPAADSRACCGEKAGPFDAANGILPGGSGPGGGAVGAVLLSPFIAPRTVSTTPYNHYSMLGSIERIFRLPPIGDANGVSRFAADVYTRPNGTPVSMTAELSNELSTLITPIKPVKPTTVAAHGYSLKFHTPEPGQVVVEWFSVPRGATLSGATRRPAATVQATLVASATQAFAQAGDATLMLVPTTAALNLLQRSRSLKLTARGTFTPLHGKLVTVTVPFMLR